MEYHQEQYREQQRWLLYIDDAVFAKENMWSLLNQMRIHRTLDISVAKKTPPVEYIPDGPIMSFSENLNSCMSRVRGLRL